MIAMNSVQDFTLQLNHTFPVKKERVFHAWTKPEELKNWWGPDGFTTTIDEMNVEVNGAYRLNMHSPDGQTHVLTGQYLEVVPHDKLVFTWKWENGEQEFPATKVTIDFLEKDDATEIVVTHANLPSEEAAQQHNFGWTSSLEESLKKYLG